MVEPAIVELKLTVPKPDQLEALSQLAGEYHLVRAKNEREAQVKHQDAEESGLGSIGLEVSK